MFPNALLDTAGTEAKKSAEIPEPDVIDILSVSKRHCITMKAMKAIYRLSRGDLW